MVLDAQTLELEKDYIKEEKTVSPLKANLLALGIMILPALALAFLYYKRWGLNLGLFGLTPLGLVFVFLLLVAGVFLLVLFHESIRALLCVWLGKAGRKSVEIGVFWKRLAPHCRLVLPLAIGRYRASWVVPFLAAGLLPLVMAYLAGIGWLMVAGFCNFIGCGTDLVVLWLLRGEKKGALALDDSKKIGAVVYRPKHQSE